MDGCYSSLLLEVHCYVFPYLSSPDSLSPMVFQGA